MKKIVLISAMFCSLTACTTPPTNSDYEDVRGILYLHIQPPFPGVLNRKDAERTVFERTDKGKEQQYHQQVFVKNTTLDSLRRRFPDSVKVYVDGAIPPPNRDHVYEMISIKKI